MNRILCISIWIVLNISISFANDTNYIQRQEAYIQYSLNHINSHSICIQAYKGIPVDPVELTKILNNVASRQTADFDIVKLIRVLC